MGFLKLFTLGTLRTISGFDHNYQSLQEVRPAADIFICEDNKVELKPC